MTKPETPVTLLSRREFAHLAGLACIAAACSTDEGGPTAPTAGGVTINGNTMTLTVGQNPTLSQSNGMVLVSQRSILVVRVAANHYQALSSVCTHQACTVSSFDGSRLTCPCHGSQFSTSGAVTKGPAASALRAFSTTFDSGTGTITVSLA
jgi:cytochrome b6-f complex iron-sulfur subunit